MKTAKDLQNYLEIRYRDQAEAIDKWLEEEVFLTFEQNAQVFDFPRDKRLEYLDEVNSIFEVLLEKRGFVIDWYDGSSFHLIIPNLDNN